MISFQSLGQSGCRLKYKDTVVYIDPYLSNSVQLLDSFDLKRCVAIPFAPAEVTDASWVLITHGHVDHCDPYTIPALAVASPQCRFVGPAPVLRQLVEWGIDKTRCSLAAEVWSELASEIHVRATPAAHPEIERDDEGNLSCVGYLLEASNCRIYFAGDTSVTEELIGILKSCSPIHTAVLPVNERNFFRDRRGIIGNMSVREAFLLAQEIGAQHVVPVHWDMFEVNSVDPDEIWAVYRTLKPEFELHFNPSKVDF
jgi:L-ascorbate metabolism protein UlaG (beta-lactamase superfamily)